MFDCRYLMLALSGVLLISPTNHAYAKPKGTITGRLQSAELREVSGITASRVNPGVVWLHNDGRANQLFGVRTTGETVAVLSWPDAVVDLEDVADGPGPNAQQDYLYLGDIGDNDSRRPQVRIYRTVEPKIAASNRPQLVAATLEDFRFTYPDGPHDAEALLVDPLTGDIFIVTKDKKQAQVFRATASELKPTQTVELQGVATLKLDNIAAGDISRDGRWILLRSEKEGWLWQREPGQTISATFNNTLPRKVPVRHKSQAKNGEGISFHATQGGYFTISEGVNQPLAFFPFPLLQANDE